MGAVAVITPEPTGPVRHHPRLGRRVPHARGAHQRRPAARRAGGARLRRRGHRPVPHRAHVPRRPAAPDPAVHPRRRRRRGARGARRSSPSTRSADFIGILEAMDGLPVTVRLLDPPLHEFLPDIEELLGARRAGELDDAGRTLLRAAEHWKEANPMLGTRGVRLGHPQARAVPHAGARAARGRDRAQARGWAPEGRGHDPAVDLEGRARARRRLGARGRGGDVLGRAARSAGSTTRSAP